MISLHTVADEGTSEGGGAYLAGSLHEFMKYI